MPHLVFIFLLPLKIGSVDIVWYCKKAETCLPAVGVCIYGPQLNVQIFHVQSCVSSLLSIKLLV